MRRTMFALLALIFTAAAAASAQRSGAAQKPLDIYYIDTEGGQATLFVSPSGQSALVDVGNAGTRDPERIMEAVKAAGLKQIDYLVITHYHGDHIGGFLELSKMIPIMNYYDHGPTIQPEQNSPSKQAYDAAIAKGPHVVPKVGDKLPISGIDWTFVTVAGKTLTTNMRGAPGAGSPNPYCADFKPKDIQVDLENAQSTGSVIAYGKFRTIDLGDLLWNNEYQLMCPTNRIGAVDVYLTTHHGLDWSNSKVVVHALEPRVAIMNNGTRKGGQIEAFEILESSPGLEDLWQLHWSYNGVLEHNAPGRFIANMDDKETASAIVANPPAPATSALGPPQARGGGGPPRGAGPGPGGPGGPGAPGAPRGPGGPGGGRGGPGLGNQNHSPAHWVKVSAFSDGAFTVTNPRNGFSKTYAPRK